MKTFILYFFLPGILLLARPVAYGQQIIASDAVSIKSAKSKIFPFSGPSANYVAIKEKSSVILLHYDTAFKLQEKVARDLDDVLNSDVLVGAAQTGSIVTFLLSDKKQNHFSTLIYQTDGHFRPGINFDMDDHMYLNWIAQNGYLAVLAVKKKSSILSLLILDSSGIRTKQVFDLSKENFMTFQKTTLYDVFSDHLLKHIQPGAYQSDLSAPYLCKMYYTESELSLTLDVRSITTQVIRLNLKSGSYKNDIVPFAQNKSQAGDGVDGNSFLAGHHLATAFIYPRGMSVGIYDLDSSRYLAEWCSCSSSWDSLVSSPLQNANMVTGDITSIPKKEKFLNKIYGTSLLSIAMNEMPDGSIELYAGGLEKISTGGGGGVMIMSGGGMGGGVPMMMPTGSSAGDDGDIESSVKRHYYFWSALSMPLLKKTERSKTGELYSKFIDDYYGRLYGDPHKNVCQFNFGTHFYIGFYNPERSILNISKY
ncbi:MAG: hypothetical protein JWO03_619 [Bacteroidetes bacterium]|nr:hypothetical protein [Bacteroidota bacterium]